MNTDYPNGRRGPNSHTLSICVTHLNALSICVTHFEHICCQEQQVHSYFPCHQDSACREMAPDEPFLEMEMCSDKWFSMDSCKDPR